MNIAMEQTEEYVDGQLQNRYGDAFIRGNNGAPPSTTPSGAPLCLAHVHWHTTLIRHVSRVIECCSGHVVSVLSCARLPAWCVQDVLVVVAARAVGSAGLGCAPTILVPVGLFTLNPLIAWEPGHRFRSRWPVVGCERHAILVAAGLHTMRCLLHTCHLCRNN